MSTESFIGDIFQKGTALSVVLGNIIDNQNLINEIVDLPKDKM